MTVDHRADRRRTADASAAAGRPGAQARPRRPVLHVVPDRHGAGLALPGRCGRCSTRFRDYGYTVEARLRLVRRLHPRTTTTNAWKQADFAQHFLNSVIITVPAVLITLFLACCVAFVVARFSFRFNLPLLVLFTAANLLPQQALLIPLYRMFHADPGAVLVQRLGHALQLLLGPDHHQRRLPDRLLRVRAEQLHEDAAARSSTRRRWSTARACCASSSRSPCRCAGRRWPRWPRSRSPGSTTTSSGRSCFMSHG